MFENGGIGISTKIYAVNEIYETIGGPSRHELEIRQVLDHVKTRFYGMEELTADWDSERRDKIVRMWMSIRKKLVGSVRRQGAAQALKELEDEGRSWPVNHDSEVEHVVQHEVKDEDSEVGD
ncbi:hypothetical protein MMC22_009956 [Lobaria immixta]|nr:hypothetical protein [Lobaria immixta]